jgi:transposase
MEVRDHRTLETLQRLEKKESNASQAKRLRIIILALQGFTAPAIALTLGMSRRAVQKRGERFNRKGLQGLSEGRGGYRQETLTEEQKSEFCERLDQGPKVEDGVCTLRGVDVQPILRQEFNLLRRLSSVDAILHRLKYSCLCPRPRHHKANPEAQAQFVEQLPQQLKAVAAAHPQRKLRLYFEDESRFGQQGTTTRIWVAVRVPRPCVRRNRNIFECSAWCVRKRVKPKACSARD